MANDRIKSMCTQVLFSSFLTFYTRTVLCPNYWPNGDYHQLKPIFIQIFFFLPDALLSIQETIQDSSPPWLLKFFLLTIFRIVWPF